MADLDGARAKLSSVEQELTAAKTRLKEVEKLRQVWQTGFDRYCSFFNHRIESSLRSLSSGMKPKGSLPEQIEDQREPEAAREDSTLIEAGNRMERERKNLEEKIGKLEEERDRYKKEMEKEQ